MLQIHTILVPVDFSEHSGLALEYAIELAQKFEARLELLHCYPINIGGRPTFYPEGQDTDTVEVHVLDFEGDLYDRELEVPLFGQLRDERRFDSPDALRAQIERDISLLRARLADGTWSLE